MPDPISAMPPTHADLQANAYNDALSHVVGGAPLERAQFAATSVHAQLLDISAALTPVLDASKPTPLADVVRGLVARAADGEQACIDTLTRVYGWRDVSPDAHPRTVLLKPAGGQ